MSPLSHDYKDRFYPQLLVVLGLLALSFLFGMKAFAFQDTDQYKIAYLMKEIENSDLTFIRNGKSYTAAEAKAHIKIKLDIAGNKVRTVDDFIDDIASRSSVSGKAYYVQYPDGTRRLVAEWLRDKLNNMKREG